MFSSASGLSICYITRLHYHVSTNLGLLQSNMTYMNCVCGMGYHWLPDLFQRMGLPLLHGVEAMLKQANVKRFEMLEHSKTEAAKNKKIQWKSQHRGTNQDKRKKWGQSQKVQHSYGDEDDEEPFVSTPTLPERGKNPAGVGLPVIAAPPTTVIAPTTRGLQRRHTPCTFRRTACRLN